MFVLSQTGRRTDWLLPARGKGDRALPARRPEPHHPERARPSEPAHAHAAAVRPGATHRLSAYSRGGARLRPPPWQSEIRPPAAAQAEPVVIAAISSSCTVSQKISNAANRVNLGR